MFDERFLTELTDRNDIVDVVGSYVNLNKKSGQNYFGLCPFHNEKTGSFAVSPQKQIYHCFGCGAGGGVINFIMQIEGLTYPEAVEFLARRAGMTVPESEHSEISEERKKLYALNKEAARFFFEKLSSGPNSAANYLQKRKITPAVAKSFGLGFAPNTWSSLRDAMNAKGYSDKDLYKAGLVKSGNNGNFYDTFRNRLMFPVIDIKGNVIAFSGRILDDSEPKYLNSPDTLIFNKGHNLFGMNLAKKTKLPYIILVEGNVDVVMLHQNGFDSAVASLGTSLTNEQARLISRFTSEVVLAYDSDGAGQKASQRAIDIFQKLDIKTRVLRMDGAKDPDEFIKAKGAAAFKNLIDRSESQIDFRLENIKNKYDLQIPEQKVDYLKEVSYLIASFPDSVTRQVYSNRVAEIASVQADVIFAEVERQRKKKLSQARRADEKTIMRATNSVQPSERQLKYDDVGSAVAEEGIIRLMSLDPSIKCDLRADEFSSQALGHIYKLLSEEHCTSIAVLSGQLSQEEMNLLIKIQQAPESTSNTKQALNDYIARIRRNDDVTDLRALAAKLKEEGKSYTNDRK